MTDPCEIIDGSACDILLLCDHASSAVPPDIDLGVPPSLLGTHVAVDLGAGDLTRALAHALAVPAILATVSRLVIDLNRVPDHPGLIPDRSDGHPVPGNVGIDPAVRIARFHAPYHDAITACIARLRPMLIVAIHSFTPVLESRPDEVRPWQVGILSNRDRRAAELVIPRLNALGLVVGDNQPYSGRTLNATLDRHAEAVGIPSFSLEIRNDLIGDAPGIARWTQILASTLAEVRNGLAPEAPFAT